MTARVLIVKLSAIGDVIHCLPVAARLKERLGCEVHWLVEPAAQSLLVGNLAIDRVIVLPKKDWLAGLKQIGKPSVVLDTMSQISRFMGELKGLHYDLALDAQGLLKSALLARNSGARRVVGFKGTREMAEHFMTDALDVGDYFGSSKHVVELNLALADFGASLVERDLGKPASLSGASASTVSATGGASGAPVAVVGAATTVAFPLPAPATTDRDVVDSLLAPLVSPAGPTIALIPATTWATKIWDASNWSALAERLVERLGARVVLIGGPGDAEFCNLIYIGLPREIREQVLDLTGKTSFTQLIEIFGRMDMVVGADTGPLHLACATQKPAVLAVHGASPWQRNGPYGERTAAVHLDLHCQPCFAKTCRYGTIACLKDLPVEEVFQAALKLLEKP